MSVESRFVFEVSLEIWLIIFCSPPGLAGVSVLVASSLDFGSSFKDLLKSFGAGGGSLFNLRSSFLDLDWSLCASRTV